MASTQQIKRRIKSVKNTKQITKAMELVAASKMRKSQEATLRSRAYRNTAREILTRISELTDITAHPLYEARPVRSRLYIVRTSDRGLAGAYNANILKMFTKRVIEDMQAGIEVRAIMIGRQGARFVSKVEGLNVIGVYEDFPDAPSTNDLRPIINTAIDQFTQAAFVPVSTDPDGDKEAEAEGAQKVVADPVPQVDEVVLVFTDFISSINQLPTQATVLPAAFVPAESPGDLADVPFEPSPMAVLETITPRLIEIQFLQAMLESAASEHSMRMMAMKSASDNAGDLIDDLTLVFNSARQAAITQELAEISGGMEAIS